MGYIETHGIKFHNETFNGHVRKTGSPNTDSNLGYITEFKDPDMLTTIINNLQLTISGHFNDVDDTDISYEKCLAYITPSGVEFYDAGNEEIIATIPLQDIYDLAVGWRNFLSEPPLNDTPAN